MTSAPAQTVLPRWRGFNLLEMFTVGRDGEWREEDFRWTAEWGFDFVRLPLCYKLWTDEHDVRCVKEDWLAKVDRAVALGSAHGLHVCLNFHHAPGYCINRRVGEAMDLWTQEAALEAFCFHWRLFAERYRGVPAARLSFNLVNEPPAVGDRGLTRESHERVMRAAVASIREVDAERLILLDGLSAGRLPCPELADLPRVAQSCRAYQPLGISHYRAPWVRGERWPLPVWPGAPDYWDRPWGREDLAAFYRPWAELAAGGVGVHCGEGGCFRYTPHEVFLTWFREVLIILKGCNIGWALWNLRGSFGVLDSQRDDVDYEDFHGHRLDRKLLELLREF